MPHTLALRQIYYWLFSAIILSVAAGGFADQWSSHAFLTQFLDGRLRNLKRAARRRAFHYHDIVLREIEPWDGGNYSWKYPKRGQKSQVTGRQIGLLLPAMAAVALPVAIAFVMSWYTPTIGLGDRGIMELSFAGMWILNFIITLGASLKWDKEKLFKIYIWNSIWSFGSLYVLFGAFQGTLQLICFIVLKPFNRMVQQLRLMVSLLQPRRLGSIPRSQHERHSPTAHLHFLSAHDCCLASYPASNRRVHYWDELGSDSIYILERRGES
jgi:hypothetical protein